MRTVQQVQEELEQARTEQQSDQHMVENGHTELTAMENRSMGRVVDLVMELEELQQRSSAL